MKDFIVRFFDFVGILASCTGLICVIWALVGDYIDHSSVAGMGILVPLWIAAIGLSVGLIAGLLGMIFSKLWRSKFSICSKLATLFPLIGVVCLIGYFSFMENAGPIF